MATCLEKLCKANRWRIRTGAMGSDETAGWNGAFLTPIGGEMWHIILSDKMGWRHLSIKNAQKRMLPSWEVMCRVKECFWGDDEWAVQYHPAKTDYISDHDWVLHLWQPLNDTLPQPPIFMV